MDPVCEHYHLVVSPILHGVQPINLGYSDNFDRKPTLPQTWYRHIYPKRFRFRDNCTSYFIHHCVEIPCNSPAITRHFALLWM